MKASDEGNISMLECRGNCLEIVGGLRIRPWNVKMIDNKINNDL